VTIGGESLGDYARVQLASAAQDPRLERGRGGMIADYHQSVEEALLSRFLCVGGITEMQASVAQVEARLGRRAEDPGLTTEATAELQAAWERAEIAKAQVSNGFPLLNGQTLITLFGAVDALVEELAPSSRDMAMRIWLNQQFDELAANKTDAAEAPASVTADAREKMVDAAVTVMARQVKIKRPEHHGVERWEASLRKAGLGLKVPAPHDLDLALSEVKVIRDVLVHRSGRIDEKAIEQCPTVANRLGLRGGDFVRIGRSDFRRYAVALTSYGLDVTCRAVAKGGVILPGTLAEWRYSAHVYIS